MQTTFQTPSLQALGLVSEMQVVALDQKWK